MTSPIDRAFIRAFAKRQQRSNQHVDASASTEKPAEKQADAPLAESTDAESLSVPTRRVDSAETVASPTTVHWQESPVMVTSFGADSFSAGATHIDVTNDGYPEGISPLDVAELTTVDPPAPPTSRPPAAPPAKESNTQRPVVQALGPEQVVRRLDDPQAVLTPHLAKPSEKMPAAADSDLGASLLIVEEYDIAYPSPEESAPIRPNVADEEHEIEAADSPEPANRAERETLPQFVPAWETDKIHWPRMADRLLEMDERFVETGRELATAAKEGLRILAITSTYRGEGRTTLAMNLARCSASQGLRVALVDADIDNPAMATAAGIAAAHSWHESIQANLPLEEAAVTSLDDGVTVLPLTNAVRRSSLTTSAPEFKRMLERLSCHYDLVIVDYGPLGVSDEQPAQPLVADAALLVRDIRCTSTDQAIAAVERVRNLGPQSVGVVQNFT